MRAGLVLAALAMAACAPTPAPAPQPAVPEGSWLLPGTSWRLVELGETPFPARTVATLTEDGRITGEAPCNRFAAEYHGRWPDLTFTTAATTRMACPELPAETAFFAALAQVNHAGLDGDGLLLTGPEGARLRFVRE